MFVRLGVFRGLVFVFLVCVLCLVVVGFFNFFRWCGFPFVYVGLGVCGSFDGWGVSSFNVSDLGYGVSDVFFGFPGVFVRGGFGSGGRVVLAYNFSGSVDLSWCDRLSFWLAPVFPSENCFYSVRLVDSFGFYKTLHVGRASWFGWREISIPLRATCVEAHPLWVDEISLRHVSSVEFIFEVQGGYVGESGFCLSGISLLAPAPGVFGLPNVLAGVLSFLVLVELSCVLLYFVLSFGVGRGVFGGWLDAERFAGGVSFPGGLGLVGFCFLGVAVKSVIAYVTPLSDDFNNIVRGVLSVLPLPNCGFPPSEGGFWSVVYYFCYWLWRVFPVDHPYGSVIFPTRNYFTMHVPPVLTPGTLLLFFCMKLPNVLIDIMSGFLVGLIVWRLAGRRELADAALFLWMVNPYVTLIVEMFASVDVVMLFFLLIGIYYFIGKRYMLGGLFVGFAIGVRLFPIVMLPLFIIFLLGKGVFRLSFHRLGFLLPGRLANCSMKIPLSWSFALISLSSFFLVTFPRLFPLHAHRGLVYTLVPDIGGLQDYEFFLGPTLSHFGQEVGVTVVLCTIYLFVVYRVWRRDDEGGLPAALLGFLMVVFAFSYFHPQFLLWCMPFLVVDYLVNGRRKAYPLIFVVLVFLYCVFFFSFYFTSWGNSFFFVPNFNSIVKTLSYALLLAAYSSFLNQFFFYVLLRSAIAGVCIAYAVELSMSFRRGGASSG